MCIFFTRISHRGIEIGQEKQAIANGEGGRESTCNRTVTLSRGRMPVLLLLLLLQQQLLLASGTWDPSSLHLFVDLAGLASVENVTLVQHRPRIDGQVIVAPDRPWDGGGGDGYIHPYVGTVQVSATELRIYYFGEGAGVRCLCVAVSRDAGPSPRWGSWPSMAARTTTLWLLGPRSGSSGRQTSPPGWCSSTEIPTRCHTSCTKW